MLVCKGLNCLTHFCLTSLRVVFKKNPLNSFTANSTRKLNEEEENIDSTSFFFPALYWYHMTHERTNFVTYSSTLACYLRGTCTLAYSRRGVKISQHTNLGLLLISFSNMPTASEVKFALLRPWEVKRLSFIIHRISLFAHNWSKGVTWHTVPQLKLADLPPVIFLTQFLYLESHETQR